MFPYIHIVLFALNTKFINRIPLNDSFVTIINHKIFSKFLKPYFIFFRAEQTLNIESDTHYLNYLDAIIPFKDKCRFAVVKSEERPYFQESFQPCLRRRCI